MLFVYDVFYLLTLEVLIDLSFMQMPSEFLRMFSELILAFFDLPNKGEERMIILLFVEFLREEGDDVYVWLFFNIHDDVINLLAFALIQGDLDGLNRNEKLSDSVVDGCEGQLLCFEGLSYEII